jgi:OOP family OmpA-OmpF porin
MRSVCLWGLIGVSATAFAADVDPYTASGSMPHKAGSPSTESPTHTNGGLSAGLTATLARNLATFDFADGTSRQLMREAFSTTLYGAYTFEEKLRIELIAPIYPNVRSGTTVESFRGAALGDLRVQGNVRLFQNEGGTFAASVVPALGIPTGRPKALVAQGPHLRLRGAVGGEVAERFGYAANAGFTLTPGVGFEDVAVGSTIDVAGAAWVHLDPRFRVGADYEQRFGVSNAPGDRNIIGWTHVFAQAVRDDGLGLSVAGGAGTYQGVGAPQWRVQAAITFAPRTRDTDGDGITDREDRCPLDAEDLDLFEDFDGCPELDNDKDTFVDVDDNCPDAPEDFDAFDDLDGCPDDDNDQDGVLDADDACPIDAGPAELQGCPDTDGDGLTDGLDQCPTDAGPADLTGCPDRDADQIADFRDACPDLARSPDEPLAVSNGCPTKAFVQGDRITITEKVLFETNRATIRPESFGLLDDVVAAMQGTPQIRRVEIAGHTDNVGRASYNKSLSERRAAAVRDYLTNKGVAAERLTSKGYGLEDPIDSNLTESGRERNRRVEFRILEQDPISEQVDVRLGADVGGLTIRLPYDRPFAVVEIDGRRVSAQAPLRGLIVQPGTRSVRVVDPRRGLDAQQTIDVKGGSTAVIDIPASAMSNPDAPLPTGPVPDGAPMAVPLDAPPAAPTERALPAVAPPPAPPAPAPVAPVTPVAPPPAPTERPQPAAPTPPAGGRIAPPADDPPLVIPDFDERVIEAPSRRPAASTTTPPATNPDTEPVPEPPALRVADPSAPAAPAGVEVGPGFGTASPDTTTGPGFGASSADVTAGPGFGAPVDPKAAKKAAKEAEKARKRAEREAASAPEPEPEPGPDAPPAPVEDPAPQ